MVTEITEIPFSGYSVLDYFVLFSNQNIIKIKYALLSVFKW